MVTELVQVNADMMSCNTRATYIREVVMQFGQSHLWKYGREERTCPEPMAVVNYRNGPFQGFNQ